ncbi:hypothetical protein BN1326_60287 [Staphylococcus argenteus]|uniref:Uncharacterized protein n=1 Tax=Staphylococcus argenteus TaxID=985002 RepID=A0A7U7JU38_9STAP|nr:hypothetical protein BN1326_60287 [Staphylococcus argenteus]CRI26388.1 hypothetical protein BN1326_60287 [Staphylococcus argenteus]
MLGLFKREIGLFIDTKLLIRVIINDIFDKAFRYINWNMRSVII